MTSGFRNLSYHTTEGVLYDGQESSELTPIHAPDSFNDDETAARYFLDQVMGQSKLESIKSLATQSGPRVGLNMHLQGVDDSPLTNTRTVLFQQTHASIPIFGSHAVVELDTQRNLVGLDAELADLQQVSPVAKLSPSIALGKIARFTDTTKKKLAGVQAPELTFFYNEQVGDWHLAYFFRRVPAAEKKYIAEVTGEDYRGHGLNNSLRLAAIEINYLVDARDGEILFYYSANPMLEVPAKCKGLDEDGQVQEFFGRLLADGFEMYDSLRNIRTYDFQLQDLDTTHLPTQPVSGPTSDWATTNRAAVSAHVNAMRVLDFYKGELKRDGIDGKGMELVSIVNVTVPKESPPPQWRNALWWQNRMWYGQAVDSDGQLRSFSRFLDVIAHELTHGVTQYTSNLVYKGQSGALNESFSDIFGIIIKNWYLQVPNNDPGIWSWELGERLGQDGLPLRDLRDPTRTGDPAHMKDYLKTVWDNGGVHVNSNIHNRAAYNLLTASDASGQRIFPSREVAILYYLTLTRLPPLADFSKVRQVLIEVARTFYAGDADERTRKIAAIRKAYSAVGIN
jgi:bacillolysin